MQKYELMIPGARSAAGFTTVVAPWDRNPIGEVALADAAAVEQALKEKRDSLDP